MAIEKMSLVRMYGRLDTLNAVLSRCMESGVFQPENPLQGSVKVGGLQEESDVHNEVMAKLTELSDNADLDPNVKKLLDSKYIRVRTGTLPNSGVSKIDRTDIHFIYFTLSEGQQSQRGFYVTTEVDLAKVEDIFDGLGFKADSSSAGFTAMASESHYQQTIANMEEAAALAGFVLGDSDSGLEVEAFEVERFTNKFKADFIKLSDSLNELEQYKTKLLDEQSFIEHIDRFNENISPIIQSGFFSMRFGRLPSDNFDKLAHYSDRQFLFFSLSEDKYYHWGFYITLQDVEDEISGVFQSLNFENVSLPENFYQDPKKARTYLQQQLEETESKLAQLDSAASKLISDNEDYFRSVYSALKRLNAAYGLRKYVAVHDNMFRIEGFVPSSENKRFSAMLEKIPGLEASFRQYDNDQRVTVPTKLKNNWLWRPFEMFIDMYGIPGYNELDPTPFVAITYTLLFGVMFGDLGQGLLIALFGFILWRVKKMQFGGILVRIGLCSAMFGLLYGSVFGLEDVLDPLYRAIGLSGKPVHVMAPETINILLLAAVAIGAVLIVITIVMNIIQGIKQRDVVRAVFSNNGAAGLIFYCGLLAAVVCKLVGGPNLLVAWYIIPVIVVPILLIFVKESLGRIIERHGKFIPEGEGFGGWFLEGFFELFEIVLSFVTNTLSFLRVGGFIISHAGMMMVVTTLMELSAGAGSVAILIIGNLFVIGLEGFIVGIQVLRLQFYELFSHYYEGQGKQFEPYTY
ncbi:MAG: hypothetical protein LBC38_03010 [Oscillospiraceae bacterium]|jgi:V/A-type H+-transporting ATPase subunit I|nr:hypothetical protein [Oscillospiraceae bacterium]